MIRKTLSALLVIVMAAVLAALFVYFIQAYNSFITERTVQEAPQKILESMTLEQKTGQLIHVGLKGKEIDAALITELKNNYAGGVILFARNLSTAADNRKLNEAMQNLAREASGIPLFISLDQEGGRVIRVTDGTELFPAAMTIGNTMNSDYARDVAVVTGYDLSRQGFNLILAPVLDVNNNPENPVINTRSFGSDPQMVSRMGRAYAAGLRSVHSTGAGKHFPGHGDTHTDSHLALPSISKTLDELEFTELLPFRDAVADGMEMIMTAHILFPKIDPVYPATLSHTILTGILREKLGFNGLIITDAMEMHAIAHNYSTEEAPRLAFRAGADIILLTSTGSTSRKMTQSLLEGFRSGQLSTDELNASVLRQITLKVKKGLITDHPALSPEEVRILKKRKEAMEAEALRVYSEVKEKYNINNKVSREGVASLHRNYTGYPGQDPDTILLFYKSEEMRQQAIASGIPESNILRRSLLEPLSPNNVLRHIRKIRKLKNLPGESSSPWIVLAELRNDDAGTWNRFTEMTDRMKGDPGYRIAGLHPGNPFLPFRSGRYSDILVSFSSTPESLRALVVRAVEGNVNLSNIHRFIEGRADATESIPSAPEDPTLQIIK